MFRKKDKKIKKPLGVQFRIELNAMTLGDVADNSEPPSTQDMAKAWLRNNCTKIHVGIAAINGTDNNIVYISGSDANVYMTMDFDIRLPFPIGPNKTDTVQVTETEDFIFLSFEDIAIMALPTSYIISSLIGEPITDYRNVIKDQFGNKSEIEIKVTSPKGEYNLPVITNVAKKWFNYENTAAKVLTTLILTNDDFPLELGVSTD